jgi:acyl-coenzyme A thioesterase PaaI-like protein
MNLRAALKRRWRRLRKWLLFRLINFWPPYFGAGVRVRRVDFEAGVAEVEMKLRWWNKNYVGTHFGGSLYSMCDPFFMLLVMERLGPGYIVWDKRATIRFRRPGRGRVKARFEVSEAEIETIRATVQQEGKSEPLFLVKVFDDDGQVIADVEKLVSVKKNKKKRGAEV